MLKKNIEEDNILIDGILDGNKCSQERLYSKYRNVISSYIRKNYPYNTYIDDDVSEILIKIFSKLESYNNTKSKFKTWVINIIKNHMIDKFRSNENVHTYSLNLNYNDNQNIVASTSDCTNTSSDYVNIVNYISSTLDTCDFTFLDMHYSQGYSYSEIATEFNMTSNTISNRVNYIKTKLRNNIGNHNLLPDVEY